ncbi:MAG: ATP-binding protein [Syntrophomonadaceae bacterium]|nr:ATP-binding protein [Syntrophomonadaceae bacterium]
MGIIDKLRLDAKALSHKCDAGIFDFATTAELKALDGIFGQERAQQALEFGLSIENEGYNIFICGAGGTGRHSLLQSILKKKVRKMPAPPDWLYAFNFRDEEQPLALSLPAGQGAVFQKQLYQCVGKALAAIEQAMHGADLGKSRGEQFQGLVEEANKRLARMEREARRQGFTITRQGEGFGTVPIKKGAPMSQDDFMGLPEKERGELMKRGVALQEKINEAMRQYRELEYKARNRVQNMEMKVARQILRQHLDLLKSDYSENKAIEQYLSDLQEDMLDKLDLLLGQFGEEGEPNFFRQLDRRSLMRRYQVNVVVDNSGLKCAPVIWESKAEYVNLFGQIDHESEFGVLSTDFTHIRGGAAHKANGGFLILEAERVLRSYYVWNELKQVLRSHRLQIENPGQILGLFGSKGLRAQSIPADFKVILVGDLWHYYLLLENDEEFRRLFRVRVDFDTDMKRDRRHAKNYARFVASVCERESLLPFAPDAVARVVEYSSRLAEDQQKLSAHFDHIKEVLCEASSCCGRRQSSIVQEHDVLDALQARKRRSSMFEDRLFENLKRDILMIDTQGERIGELNGLAVYNAGDYMFARPLRITAKTWMGEKGLVNIERETQMSGRIHSKGVLTLNGYLGSQYAQYQPLSLSASLTFEQSYGGIEGDSASSAELYAILSSLGQFPLRQGIAVTGSVNQNGEIQAVGGVNEKIEAFFRLCRQKGLTGEQGVIIPCQNVRDLMLEEELVTAVADKRFSIWAIAHIDEGIEILSGLPAGERQMSSFTEGSVHALVDQRFRKWNQIKRSGQADNMVSANVIRRRMRR